MTLSLRHASWGLALLFVSACGKDTTNTDDMTSTIKDMTTQSTDMAMVPPTLTIPGTCTVPANAVTLASFYSTIINAKCALSNCHVSGAQSPTYGPNSSSMFSTNTVNKPARAGGINYITPNNPDTSFLLYKITGQQAKVTANPGPGLQMPLDSTFTTPQPLSAADQCTLINWVRTGAT